MLNALCRHYCWGIPTSCTGVECESSEWRESSGKVTHHYKRIAFGQQPVANILHYSLSMTESVKEALKRLEEELTCGICLEPYVRPKLLQCFHVFCEKCILQLESKSSKDLLCPNCRQPTTLPQNGVPGLQGAFHIHHLFDIQSVLKKSVECLERPCEKCGDASAVCFCHNCGQFICPACTKVHQTWKELSSHEVITIQQLTSDAAKLVPSKKQAMPCPKHPAKELDLYCETCEELICRDCTVKVHRDHQYDLVGDTFPRHKDVIVASLQPVEQQLASVSKALEGLDTRCGQITEQQKAIEADIETSIRQLHEALEARKQDLIGQLEQTTRQKLKSLAAQQDQFELVGTQLRSCRDFVQESLRTGSKAEILAMKKPVVKQIAEALSTAKPDVLSLSPHEQPNMQISFDLANLVQMIQKCGSIITRSVCPEKCHTVDAGVQVAVVGEPATALVRAVDQEGREYCEDLHSLSCELISSDGSVCVAAEVRKREENEYEISYQPRSRGQHHLHIQVEGRHISGSPLPVMVKLPIHKFGTPVGVLEGLKGPWGVEVSEDGRIFVAECGNNCVSVFDSEGKRLTSFGNAGNNTSSSSPGCLHHPKGVALLGNSLLVCDCGNGRIQRFSLEGEFLEAYGKKGSDPLEFNKPMSIRLNPHNGKLYVVDTWNYRVQILNSDMTFLLSFGGRGSRRGEFELPYDIAFDSTGNALVVDHGNHRIQVFSEDGRFLRELGGRSQRMGGVSFPTSIAVDLEDILYVSEVGSVEEGEKHRISIFTCGGWFLRSFGTRGSRRGQFHNPHGTAVDRNGLVYVSDLDNGRVQIF